MDEPSARQCQGLAWLKTQRFVAIGKCRVQILPGRGSGTASAGIAGSKARIEPNRFVEIRNGVVVFLLCGINHAASVVGKNPAGIEPDRLAVIANGAVVLHLFTVQPTAIVERESACRVEPDRFAVFGKGGVVILFNRVFVAANAVPRAARRIKLE